MKAPPHAPADAHCRNCGAPAPGRYCPACGQATALHPPTVREFVHEFVGHHLAVDGALWRTLRALLLTPGRLTVDYFAGRRARYIGPLRLYLTFSLILFVVSGMSGEEFRIGSGLIEFRMPERAQADDMVIAPRVANDMATGIAFVDRRMAHAFALTPQQRTARITGAMRQYLPYVLILLVPVLALCLKLVYWNRGRLYGEHLVVAFHAQTVVFIFALITAALPWDLTTGLVIVLLLVQGCHALRAVYGGRLVASLLRELVLFATYGAVVLLALAVTATLAVFL